jgi:hypothetical protein
LREDRKVALHESEHVILTKDCINMCKCVLPFNSGPLEASHGTSQGIWGSVWKWTDLVFGTLILSTTKPSALHLAFHPMDSLLLSGLLTARNSSFGLMTNGASSIIPLTRWRQILVSTSISLPYHASERTVSYRIVMAGGHLPSGCWQRAHLLWVYKTAPHDERLLQRTPYNWWVTGNSLLGGCSLVVWDGRQMSYLWVCNDSLYWILNQFLSWTWGRPRR